MDKKASMATATTDWRTEITKETRQKKFHSIWMVLERQFSGQFNMNVISDHARKHEMKLFSQANSTDEYLNAGIGKLSKRENHRGSSSSRAAVVYPQYHQPTPQLRRQHPKVRQAHQQFAMQNQSCASLQNTSNSQSRPQGFQRQDIGIHLSSEMFTQHPNFVNLTTQVEKEANSEGFKASKSLHQHEQHKQQHSMRASAERIPSSEVLHDAAFAEMEQLKKTFLPLIIKAYEPYRKVHPDAQHKNRLMKTLERILTFFHSPKEKIIASYTKERFYRCLKYIEQFGNTIKCNTNVANKQSSLHGGQPGLSGSRINHPLQQSDNVKLPCQSVIRATTGSSGSSSPIAPQEKGSVRSETDYIQKNLLQNRQHYKSIKSKVHPQWIHASGNTPATYRSGMSLNHHLNSNFSHQIHDASQLCHVAERPRPTKPCTSPLYGIASPAPSSPIVGLEKTSPNVTYHSGLNFQSPQHCNPYQLLHSKTETQVPSQKIRSSSAMTSPVAEPTSPGINGQFSTYQAYSRLLKAVGSSSRAALRAAVSGITSVGYMEDAIIDPRCHAMVTNLRLLNGCGSSNNMKRKINAMALNNIPSPRSDIPGSEETVTSRTKKLKKHTDSSLLEEIRNINKQFIETVLELDVDENLNRRLANAGTVLRCSYSAVIDGTNSEAYPVKLPVLTMKLLVPLDYPEDYPVFLSKFDSGSSNVDEECSNLSNEAMSMLRAFLRTAPECVSLEEYARVWDECARSVVSDYVQRAGGGSFSARYGTWEDSVATA
ncbi:putative tartrate dehydrogenase/decarboxylase ttuC [Cucumis melo var. makuwa]|nr:hypothetical protein [Cucumis melo subsp. melo]KAA0053897.1 putative tartrate dehydrogenase/decarboxylase ttuC [Cucumis melo var. makuwa]TYK25509.1 putative tartrate dehydrogenase/decarboxylase ttuC [Cucumis melo var. makuwa]